MRLHALTGTRAFAISSPCAATRLSREAPTQPHPRRLCRCDRTGLRTQEDSAVRHLRRRISGSSPGLGSVAADLDNLKRKVDAGADRAITQFFFSPDCFLRFQDSVAAAGMDIEVVPGILPVSNVAQTRRFADLCGAGIPDWLNELVRRARRPSGRPSADRRDRRRRAVRPALRGRRPTLSFLHAQSRGAQLRDLSSPRR